MHPLFGSVEDSDPRALFTLHPTPRTYAEAVVSLMQRFLWQRFVIISHSDSESFYTNVRMFTSRKSLTGISKRGITGITTYVCMYVYNCHEQVDPIAC